MYLCICLLLFNINIDVNFIHFNCILINHLIYKGRVQFTNIKIQFSLITHARDKSRKNRKANALKKRIWIGIQMLISLNNEKFLTAAGCMNQKESFNLWLKIGAYECLEFLNNNWRTWDYGDETTQMFYFWTQLLSDRSSYHNA